MYNSALLKKGKTLPAIFFEACMSPIIILKNFCLFILFRDPSVSSVSLDIFQIAFLLHSSWRFSIYVFGNPRNHRFQISLFTRLKICKKVCPVRYRNFYWLGLLKIKMFTFFEWESITRCFFENRSTKSLFTVLTWPSIRFLQQLKSFCRS